MTVVAKNALAQLYLEFHSKCERVDPDVFMDDRHVRSDRVMKAILEYVTDYNVTMQFFDIRNFNTDDKWHSMVTFIWRPQAIRGIRARELSSGNPSFVFPADFTKEIFSFFDGAYMSLKPDKRTIVLAAVRKVVKEFVNEDAMVVCMSESFEDLKDMFTYEMYLHIDKAFTLSYVNTFHN